MRQRRSWFVPALLAAAISAVGLAPAAAAQEEEPGLLAVGRLLLDPCEDVEGAWCGGRPRGGGPGPPPPPAS
jgi:hypothetical protein